MEKLKKTGTLWIIFLSVTITLILYTQTGIWLSFQFGAVSTAALVCWLNFNHGNQPDRKVTVPLYILAVTVFLILCTCRYSSGYANFIQREYAYLFNGHFKITHTSWFILMVCLPVSSMLAGGYLLAGGRKTGVFFAWLTFFFVMAESLIQFNIEMLNTDYRHNYYVGIFTAILLFLLGAYGIMALLKNAVENQLIQTFPVLNRRRINLWSVLFVTLVILYGISLYSQAGILPVGIIAGSMMGGMIGWRKTTSWHPANPYKLVPLYLLLQALFYVHVGEETLTHFNRGIATISGHPWKDTGFDYLIALIGPVIWIFAAWSLWKGQAFGNFILWFIIVGMIIGEPTHILVFPVIRMIKEGVGYEYFSGMYTSLFPMIPAIIALSIIISDYKARRAAHA